MSKAKADSNIIIQKKTHFTADTIAYVVSFFGISLLPFVFWPWLKVPLTANKAFWLLLVVLITVFFWLIGRLQKSQIIFPKNWTLVAAFGVVITTFLSGVFSDNLSSFLFGKIFTTQSFILTLSLFLLFFLVSSIYEKRQRVINLYILLFVVSIGVGLYVLLRLIIGVLTNSSWITTFLPINLIGGWYDSGIFFGFIAISTLIILELWPTKESKWFNMLLYLVFGFSLLMMILANFYLVWIVFGLFSLFLFVYTKTITKSQSLDVRPNSKTKIAFISSAKFFKPALIALLISIFFVIFGSTGNLADSILDKVYNQAGISFVDVRPSWFGTFTVAKGALKDDVLFGVGAGNFDQAWSLYYPPGINQLPYWNINFLVGVGIIPSFLITTGLIGFTAWLFFLVSLFFYGLKGVFDKKQDTLTRLMIFLLFTGSVYLWVFAFIYSVSITLFALAFIISGLLIGQLTAGRIISPLRLNLAHEPRFHFVAVLGLILLVMISLASTYFVVQKYWALANFYQTINLNQNQPPAELEKAVLKTINLDSYDDFYFRTLVDIGLLNLNSLLEESGGLSETELRDSFQIIFSRSLGYADKAVALNPNSYRNWLSRASLYEILVPFQVEDASAKAHQSYDQALKLNPNSPAIRLNLARLALAENDNAQAYIYLEEALAQKNNFVEALFMLAQLDLRTNNEVSARRRLEQAILIAPNDPVVYLEQGILEYNLQDFSAAIVALKQALNLSPNKVNDNARYFLGLSYSKLGWIDDALAEFGLLAQSNPDNAEIKKIIFNLQSGLPALPNSDSDISNLDFDDNLSEVEDEIITDNN